MKAEAAAATPPTAAVPLAAEVPDLWVLCWSQSQNAFHVEPLIDMVKANLEAFTDGRRMDYVPLCISTREEVDTTADVFRPTLERRERERMQVDGAYRFATFAGH